jgi:hypothetical protein
MSWLSGSCDPDDEGGMFIVFEERPEGSTEPPVVRSEGGRVIWIDSGSGPGFERPWPEKTEETD